VWSVGNEEAQEWYIGNGGLQGRSDGIEEFQELYDGGKIRASFVEVVQECADHGRVQRQSVKHMHIGKVFDIEHALCLSKLLELSTQKMTLSA